MDLDELKRKLAAAGHPQAMGNTCFVTDGDEQHRLFDTDHSVKAALLGLLSVGARFWRDAQGKWWFQHRKAKRPLALNIENIRDAVSQYR